MIIQQDTHWIRLLFRVRGSSLEETWPRILAATAFATVVTFVELRFGLSHYTLTTTPFTLIGVPLGIFLGFRNNAAYDRFWEASKLWSSLAHTSRTLAGQANLLIHAEPDNKELQQFRQTFVKRIIAYVHSLCHKLRDSDATEDIARFLPDDEVAQILDAPHKPRAIRQTLGRDIAYARDQKWIHELVVPVVAGKVSELAGIAKSCERIKTTPVPFPYTALINRLVTFYCFSLPFGLVDTVGLLTPAVVLLTSHAFFGLDAIGNEIQQPFSTTTNCIPLAAISRDIEIELLGLIDDPQLPQPLLPDNGLLL
jgi:putative membrane protein